MGVLPGARPLGFKKEGQEWGLEWEPGAALGLEEELP